MEALWLEGLPEELKIQDLNIPIQIDCDKFKVRCQIEMFYYFIWKMLYCIIFYFYVIKIVFMFHVYYIFNMGRCQKNS